MYRLILMVINLNIFSLMGSLFVIMVTTVFPTKLLDYWMFPLDHGFDAGDTTFGESLEVLGQTFLVLVIKFGIQYIYDHVSTLR